MWGQVQKEQFVTLSSKLKIWKGKSLKRSGLFVASLFAAAATSAFGGAIPYPNPGTVAPEVTTYASSSAGVQIYFYGSTANYYDYVNVLDTHTGYTSGYILNNHGTSLGSELTIGTQPGQIDAGDQLVFYIESPEGQFASLASYSADDTNHAYITAFNGGTLNGVSIPAGLFVGLEDQASYHSDFNYNDDTFVFANVSAPGVNPSVTPEPSSLLLFGTGLISFSQVARRRLRQS